VCRCGWLASRVWIEQAKGVLAATTWGVSPDAAFQQLRTRARSSSRKLADLAQEVVQAAQRERVAALAVDDARVRAAEARARAAEQALQAAQTGLARRTAALDRAQDDLDERERAADQRNHLADERTGPSAIPTSVVGGTKRQQGTSEAAPNGCGRGGDLRVTAQPSPPKQVPRTPLP
jgi:ANTAR domain